jgi:hypothetical protein
MAIHVQVHRFGNEVALWTGGETIYLSAQLARSIARALRDVAKDVDAVPSFAKSKSKTHTYTVEV